MKEHGHLKADTVVATTMSNMGLEAALKRSGIAMLRAPVGDKYVLEQMLKTGATLGGEQSGHILFRDIDTTTGDGILTALRVLEVMARTGKPLAELVADMKVFPQGDQERARAREEAAGRTAGGNGSPAHAAERELDGNGRVVVRYSGTEKLARVMIEAESEAAMRRHTDAIASAIQRAIKIIAVCHESVPEKALASGVQTPNEFLASMASVSVAGYRKREWGRGCCQQVSQRKSPSGITLPLLSGTWLPITWTQLSKRCSRFGNVGWSTPSGVHSIKRPPSTYMLSVIRKKLSRSQVSGLFPIRSFSLEAFDQRP